MNYRYHFNSYEPTYFIHWSAATSELDCGAGLMGTTVCGLATTSLKMPPLLCDLYILVDMNRASPQLDAKLGRRSAAAGLFYVPWLQLTLIVFVASLPFDKYQAGAFSINLLG